MNWFKHDSDASTDAKIKKLLIKYGAEGYAIYFHCLELIAGDINESNITFQLEHDAEIIADNLKIKGTADYSGVDRVQDIMKYIISLDLFQESNGHIFCFKLLKRLDSSMTSNVKLRALVIKAKEHHDDVMTKSCKKRIDKKRREEKRLDNSETKKDEVRQEKDNDNDNDNETKTPKNKKPTLEEVKQYFKEQDTFIDPETFFYHYETNGWVRGKNTPVKNWKACLKTWEAREKKDSPKETKIKHCTKCGASLYNGICSNVLCENYRRENV